MSAPYEIVDVEYLGGFRLRVTFADGLKSEFDMADKLKGNVGPVFEPLRELEFFARVSVDSELGTITWPNGADLAPDVLHEQAKRVA